MTTPAGRNSRLSEARIRLSEPSDRGGVLELYREVWGEDLAELMSRCWAWKYDRHPFRRPGDPPGLALDLDGRILGFLGLMPARLKMGCRVEQATWGVDLMVAPEARGRSGLQLARALFRIGRFALGGPGPVYHRMWSHVIGRRDPTVATLCRVRRKSGLEGLALRMAGTLSDLPTRLRAGRGRRRRGADGVRVEASGLVGLDAWLPEALASYENIAWRDEAYLRWRFTDCPYGSHRAYLAHDSGGLRGYMVLREDLPMAVRIVDLLAAREDEAAFVALLQAALRRARALGRSGAETVTPAAGGLARALRHLGFFPSLRRPAELRVIAQNNDPSLDEALFGHQAAWFFTLADSDFDMRGEDEA